MDRQYCCPSPLLPIIILPPFSLTSLPLFRLLHFLLLPFAPGVAHGEEEQPALFCSSGLSSSCRTQMVIMELHINWLCWKLTVAVKGSRQPVPVCPCARWCIGSSWWTRCLHSALLLFKVSTKVVWGLSDLHLFVLSACALVLLDILRKSNGSFEMWIVICRCWCVFTQKWFFISLTVCVCVQDLWVHSRMEASVK